MGSEASRTGFGAEAVSLQGIGPIGSDPVGVHAAEQVVLLTRLRALEERAKRLEYLETRLRDLNHEVQRLTHLADASHTLHAADSTEQVIDTVLTKALELLHADSGSICLLEGEATMAVHARGSCHEALDGMRVPACEGVVGYVVQRREPVLVADIAADGRFVPSGSPRHATGSFIAVPVLGGERPLGVLAVSDRDDGRAFTERDLRLALRLAQDLATAPERVRRLEATQASHHQFVRTLAHELRNPLDGVLRFINLSLTDQHPEECRRRYLMASKHGLERLTGIVNSLSGSCHRAPGGDAPAEVGDLLRQAVQLQEGKAEQRGIHVELDIEEGLPPVCGGDGLFQVFTNLIANAYDAMQNGGGTLTVEGHRDNGAVVVRIADTGCGMPPRVAERIFAPFFTTKSPGKGMGLGLAVCREIISRLCGQIDVASEPGRGTEFTVSVPHARSEGAVTH